MLKKIIDIFPPAALPTPPTTLPTAPREEKIQPFLDSGLPKEIRKKKRKLGIGKKAAGGVSLFLILSLVFLNFFFTRVDIEIWPETETMSFNEKVVVDGRADKLDLALKIIPGKVFEEEKSVSRQFSSSGKIQKEQYAQGIIRVYNNYSVSQTLVKNTRFQAPLEKVLYFRSTKPVVIPAKGYIDIQVKADRPGEEYNIEPATFSLPGLAGLPQYYSVYGKSSSAMTGGFKGEAPQIKQEDPDEAKKILLEEAGKQIKDDLANKIPENSILLDEATFQEIITASSSAPVGAEVNSFIFDLKIKIKTIVFTRSDLDDFAEGFVNSRPQKAGKKIQPESLNVGYSPESVDKNAGKIVLNLKISAKIYSDVDLTNLKRSLLEKSLNEARLLLENQPQITKVQIKAFPFWLKKIPSKESKIEITLNLD